jgi:SAM-dependent methyltransferase
MSGFSADWLQLREPFDAAARAATLVAKLRRRVASGTTAAPQQVVDLGCGTGANLRYLAPRLGGVQHWRLVDHDRGLLEAALETTSDWALAAGAEVRRQGLELTILATDFACRVQCEQRDLSARGTTPLTIGLPQGGLVTASALLDLVSSDWLNALASRCHDARAAACFALTYDGRALCSPAEPEDGEVLELFNRHQLGDKGFGAALGPGAAVAARAVFAARGYRTGELPSDWQVGRQDRAMQRALLDGWLGAALEIAPNRQSPLTQWHERRCAHVDAGQSQLRVGHVDLIGWI